MARQKRTAPAARPVPASNDNETARRALAPWPHIDKYPILLGSNLTLQYLSSAYRLCQVGYRYNFVDALDELLERDAHAYAVLWQRICAVSGGKLQVIAAHAEKDTPEAERAELIRSTIEQRIKGIPALQQHLADLLWGIYYGITAAEIIWERREDGWHVADLGYIHSRRLSYPDTSTWDLRIWDQGGVRPGVQWAGGQWQWPTGQLFGIRVADYPGKFLIFAPKLRGDYPTREGLGREIAWYMAMKLMAIRGGGQFVERYGKPFAFAYHNTKTQAQGGYPRVADTADINTADEALRALGIGSLSSAVLPDSIDVKLDGPAIRGGSGSLNHEKFIALLNGEVSKAVRGGTLTTEAGDHGARSLGEVHERGDTRNARYDASCLSETLQELAWWICHLNFPGEEHLCSKIEINVEDISPAEFLKLAADGAAAGLPVDADKVAAKVGLPLLPLGEHTGRRMAPVKPVTLAALEPTEDDASRIAGLVHALAEATGVSLTPTDMNLLAAMPVATAAQFVASLVKATKQPEESTPAKPNGVQDRGPSTDVS